MECTNVEVVFLLASMEYGDVDDVPPSATESTVGAAAATEGRPPSIAASSERGTDLLVASMSIDLSWHDGYCATVVVTNQGTTPTMGWTVDVTLAHGTLTSIWNATPSIRGDVLTMTATGHYGEVPPNGSVTFGFCVDSTSNVPPQIASVRARWAESSRPDEGHTFRHQAKRAPEAHGGITVPAHVPAALAAKGRILVCYIDDPQWSHAGHKGLRDLLTEGTPDNVSLKSKLDYVAKQIERLGDADVPLWWTPLHPVRQRSWLGWNRGKSSEYLALWEYMYDYLKRTRGLHNVAWLVPRCRPGAPCSPRSEQPRPSADAPVPPSTPTEVADAKPHGAWRPSLPITTLDGSIKRADARTQPPPVTRPFLETGVGDPAWDDDVTIVQSVWAVLHGHAHERRPNAE